MNFPVICISELQILETHSAFLLHTDGDTWLAHIWDLVAFFFFFILLWMPPLLFSQNVNICSVCILIASPGCLVEDEGCGHSDASGSLAMCWDFVSYDRSLASRQPPVLCPWLNCSYGSHWNPVLFYSSLQRGNPELSFCTHTKPQEPGWGSVMTRASYTAHLQAFC